EGAEDEQHQEREQAVEPEQHQDPAASHSALQLGLPDRLDFIELLQEAPFAGALVTSPRRIWVAQASVSGRACAEGSPGSAAVRGRPGPAPGPPGWAFPGAGRRF